MNQIKTLFFDLGGVLLELCVDSTVDMLAHRSGLNRQVVEQAFPLDDYYRYERGEMDEDRFFRLWNASIGSERLTDNDFFEAWDLLVGNELETVAIMRKLQRQFKVYILSNTNDFHIRSLTPRFDFFEQVDGRIYSYRLGCRKPESRIFELALEQSGGTARESLFIDDMPVNVEAAHNLGFHTILFTGVDDLKNELKLLGIDEFE